MIDVHNIQVQEIRIDTTIKGNKVNTYYLKGVPPKPPRPRSTTRKDSVTIKFKVYGKNN